MLTSQKEKTATPLSGAALVDGIRKLLASGKDPAVLRWETEIPTVDPLAWLAALDPAEYFYWSGREGDPEFAAVGVADQKLIRAMPSGAGSLQAICRLLAGTNPNVRFFGGFCFDPGNLGAEWNDFGASQFILPRFELKRTQGKCTLACNILASELADRKLCGSITVQWDKMNSLNVSAASFASPVTILNKREDHPAVGEFLPLVEKSLQAIAGGRIQKVVLARQTVFHLNGESSPARLTQKIKAANPRCFHFCFVPKKGTAFLGASPERLYRREGEHLDTEALAGTRPRGRTPQEDEQLKKELLGSSKDRHEQKIVAEYIEQNLNIICTTIKAENSQPLQLTEGQHLCTSFAAEMKNGIADAQIIERLHPTPAVAGTPTAKALEIIRSSEPFSRGWYAGGVGWVAAEAAEFAVGIRSGLLKDRTLALYSGAGIVAGSSPQQEWDEIENKMNSLLKALSA